MQKVPLSSKIEAIKDDDISREISITRFCACYIILLSQMELSNGREATRTTLIASIFELNGTFCIIFYFL